MPCRNVLPKPRQKPHPPMWMACTNRDTIKVAAPQRVRRAGVQLHRPGRGQGVGRHLLRHHPQRGVRPARPLRQRQHRARHRLLAPRGSQRGDTSRPGRLRVLRLRAQRTRRPRSGARAHDRVAGVPGAPLAGQPRAHDRCRRRPGRRLRELHRHPADAARYLRQMQDVGVDQVIFIQQAGRNRHADICSSLELFAAEVLPEFAAEETDRQRARPPSWRRSSRPHSPARRGCNRWPMTRSPWCAPRWRRRRRRAASPRPDVRAGSRRSVDSRRQCGTECPRSERGFR